MPRPNRPRAAIVAICSHRLWTILAGAALLVFAGSVAGSRPAFSAPAQDAARWADLRPSGTADVWKGAAAFDPAGNRLLAFGNYVHDDALQSLDLTEGSEAWREIRTAQPKPRGRVFAAAAMDESRNRLVVFGGRTQVDGAAADDTWALDLSASPPTWRRIAEVNPPPGRIRGTLVYIPAGSSGYDNDVMVLFGGAECEYNPGLVGRCPDPKQRNDTWILDLDAGNERWRELSPCGTLPVKRMYHGAAYDPRGNRMIVFGGLGSNRALSDVWSLDLTAGSECWEALDPAGARIQGVQWPIVGYDACPGAEQLAVIDPEQPRYTWSLSLTEAGSERWIKTTAGGASPRDLSLEAPSVYDHLGRRLVHTGGWALTLPPCEAPTPTATPPMATETATQQPSATATAFPTETVTPSSTATSTLGPTLLPPTATATPTKVPKWVIWLPRLDR